MTYQVGDIVRSQYDGETGTVTKVNRGGTIVITWHKGRPRGVLVQQWILGCDDLDLVSREARS